MTEDWEQGGFGIYIHWPFCASKCPYCDFNSHVARTIDQKAWANAYLAELDRMATLTPNRILRSVFFGGGTPSLMDPELIDEILQKVRQNWRLANDIEVTLEANPGSVEAGRFAGYAEAGVNRVSLGIQALNEVDLKRLGRLHSVQEALSALEIANRHFDRVNFDLIYARQDQTLDDWRVELKKGLNMAKGHLSLYQLTIEPNTAFGDLYKAGRLRGLPPDDNAAAMYELTQELCHAGGYPAYEVSNHASPGQESRHNLVYWRYGDYIGIGPGAHGRLTLNGRRYATEEEHQPARWLAQVHEQRPTMPDPISPQEQGYEYLIMGLRISEGIDLERYSRLTGVPIAPEQIAFLQDIGMVILQDGRLKATERGRMVLNSVIDTLTGNAA